MQQVIGIEQFLNSFPLEKRLWLVEKKQGSCVAAGELVDEFEQTRRLEEVKATVDGTGPKKGAGDPSCGLGHPVSVEELKTLQKQNETLAEVWRAAEKALEQNETGYFKEDGVLYRKWVPTD
eukprot:Em0091g13a